MNSPYDFAQRLRNEIEEMPGDRDHPFIQWCLMSCPGFNDESHDEIPWCSAFMNRLALIYRVSASNSARARSWLRVGTVIALEAAWPGFDIIILKRGGADQPGPEVLNAQGHVGFYAGREKDVVYVLGGNQSNNVTLAPFPGKRILGVRRLL